MLVEQSAKLGERELRSVTPQQWRLETSQNHVHQDLAVGWSVDPDRCSWSLCGDTLDRAQNKGYRVSSTELDARAREALLSHPAPRPPPRWFLYSNARVPLQRSTPSSHARAQSYFKGGWSSARHFRNGAVQIWAMFACTDPIAKGSFHRKASLNNRPLHKQ